MYLASFPITEQRERRNVWITSHSVLSIPSFTTPSDQNPSLTLLYMNEIKKNETLWLFSVCYVWVFYTCCKNTVKRNRIWECSWKFAGTFKSQLSNDKMTKCALQPYQDISLWTVYALKESRMKCFNLKTAFYHISLLGSFSLICFYPQDPAWKPWRKPALKKNKYLTLWIGNYTVDEWTPNTGQKLCL